MNGRNWIFLVILLGFISAVITLSFAAPSAELNRDVGANVASDNTALVQLTPNPQYDFVQLNSNGELTASPQNLGADSVNAEMTLTIGDTTAPNTDYAFTIKNTQNKAVQYNLSLQQQNSFSGTPTDVEYIIQKDTGTTYTISADNTEQSFIVQPTETLYVTISIDSTGQQTGNLDTTLVIDAKTN